MKKLVLIIPILLLIGVGCQNSTTIMLEPAAIVRDMYLKESGFAFEKSFNNDDYIVTYVDDTFIVLKKFAKTWQESYKVEILGMLAEDATEFKKFDDDLVFYFATVSQGTTLGSADFNAYSFKDAVIYKITASGNHGNYNQMKIDQELDNHKNILSFLEDKIGSSKYIYVPTKKDLDIDLPQNAEKKWVVENQNIYSRLQTLGESMIKLGKYSIKNFPVDTEQTKWEVENDSYKITSFFKGAIYLNNKSSNSYSVLWVPEDVYGWIERMEFTSTNRVVFYDRLSNEPQFEIDIKNFKVTKL